MSGVGGLACWAERYRASRAPDFIIGGADNPYIKRWWLLPRNKLFNVYLHEIIRSDDDRALHDHPWWNCSFIIAGQYVEHTIDAGGIEKHVIRRSGSAKFRFATAAHRLEVEPGKPAITLFFIGPRFRSWGFHCPRAGWVHWRDFTAPEDKGQIGRGCGDDPQSPAHHGASLELEA